MRRSAILVFGALFTLAAFNPAPVGAQGEDEGVTYTSVAKFEVPGPIGAMMGQQDHRETTYVQGPFMLTEDEDQGTVFDFSDPEQLVLTFMQHTEQTYYKVTMEEMQARMGAAVAQAGQPQGQRRGEGADQPPQFEIKFSMDPTGRSTNFDGYSAEQVVMTVELVPVDETAQQEGAGTMAIVTELWLSTDFPGHEEIRKAQSQMAEGFVGGGGMGAAFQQAFASDPRMKEAFEENMEKMKDLEGMPVKTVTSFVTVPVGMELDREAVLAATDEPLGEGMGAAVGEGAAEAARGAMRNLTRGILGRRRQQEEEPEPETEAGPVAQVITMRTFTTIDDVRLGHIPPETFLPREGYVEQVPEWMRTDPGASGS
ncbi:hypothetical protein ACFL3S_07485 [Gemmatimonadota bacterium]